jgi:hypothetical protein
MDWFIKIASRVASNYKKQHFTCKGHRWKVPDILDFIEANGIVPTMVEVEPLYQIVANSAEGYFDEPFASPEFMARAMESNYQDYPVVLFMLPDRTRIADGNHRVVKAHEEGATLIPAYVLPEETVWAIPNKSVVKKASKNK